MLDFTILVEKEDSKALDCVFPFEYKGTIHNKCTYDLPDLPEVRLTNNTALNDLDWYQSLTKPWCATRVPFSKYKQLKSCSSNDASEGKGKKSNLLQGYRNEFLFLDLNDNLR